MTCRSLYGIREGRSLPLELAEKEKLLLLLEKDIPFLYYCHHYTKLPPWHGRWSKCIAPWYEERLPCKQSLDKHLYATLSCPFHYYFVRLVMNRHLHGSRHGLPLHVLNIPTQSYYHSDGVVNSASQHARILNNQLLVLPVISSTHPRGDSVSFKDHINIYGHSVCDHLTLSQDCAGSIPA